MARSSDEKNLRTGVPESIYGNLDEVDRTTGSKSDSGVSRIDREIVPSLEKKDRADVTFTKLESKSSLDSGSSIDAPSVDGLDESRIRERAYDLYVQSGYVDGHADEHWYIARREIEQLYSEAKPGSKTSTVKEPTFPSLAQAQSKSERKVA